MGNFGNLLLKVRILRLDLSLFILLTDDLFFDFSHPGFVFLKLFFGKGVVPDFNGGGRGHLCSDIPGRKSHLGSHSGGDQFTVGNDAGTGRFYG